MDFILVNEVVWRSSGEKVLKPLIVNTRYIRKIVPRLSTTCYLYIAGEQWIEIDGTVTENWQGIES